MASRGRDLGGATGLPVVHDDIGVVPVYSVAKVFTAAAALLSFDERAAIGSLTAVPARLAELTLGDLLAHRSGLGDYGAWPDYHAAVDARETAWPAEAVLDRAELGEPGVFRYSNVGYLLVRRAIEDAAGAPFFDAIDRLVLGPLGVAAYPFATVADWARCADSTVPRVREYDPAWVYTGTVAAGVADAAAGVAGLMAGGLGADVAERMRRTLPVDAPGHPLADPGYGLGLMTSGRPPRVVGHGGGGPGFTLFVVATADGSRAHGEVVPAEVDDRPLIETCVAAVSSPR